MGGGGMDVMCVCVWGGGGGHETKTRVGLCQIKLAM